MDYAKALFIGLLVLLFRKSSNAEEPANFQDNVNYSGPFTESSELSEFCPLNFSSNASTAHFSIEEFHSKDGTAVPEAVRGNIQLLMQQLEVIRAYLGGLPVFITSGYRSIAHNANVNGASQSYHLCGMAADFFIPGLTNDQVQEAVEHLMLTGQIINGGLGRYNTFTHYDIGPMRRWDKR